MTAEDFDELPFRMVSHMAMADEHCCTYVNDKYGIMVLSIPRKGQIHSPLDVHTFIICTWAKCIKQRINFLKQ